MAKKLKFQSTQNIAKPVSADSVRLVETRIRHRDGGVIVTVDYLDGDSVSERDREIHMGDSTAAPHVNLDKFERDILKVVQSILSMHTDLEE